MALETWYDAGTVSVAQGSTTVTASNAYWGGDAIMAGDLFCDPAQPLVPPQRVMSVVNDTTLELWAPWPGTSLTDDTYEIRYVGIIERSTAQTRRVLEQLGEVSAYFDVQVNTLADRAAFDSRPAGFRVLVSDIGDGSAAIYSKVTAAPADWSDPATLGSQGPEGLPGPAGITWRGVWSSATAYAALDGVLYNGSSWRAKQASQNQVPPTLPTIENTYWHLVAQKGTDGSGTGDVTGPASSVSGRIAIYSGTTGKQLGQAGVAVSDLQPAGSYEPARAKATQAQAEAGTGTTVLGWAPEQIAQMIASRSPPTADLEFTVSQLAIALADATNVAQFLGSNGNRIADSFDALTYVDVAGATNLDTSAAGLLRATAPTTTLGTPVDSGNFADFTHVFRGSDLPNGSKLTKVGVYLTSAKTIDLKIVRQNSTTNFDVIQSMPFSHPGGGWADYNLPVPFEVPASGQYNLGAYANASNDRTGAVARSVIAGNQGVASGVSGWTAASAATFAFRFSLAPNNLTVRSSAFSASAIPTKMKALIQVREVDAAAAGTDYTLECSRDNGTTWAVMALTERYSVGNGLILAEAAQTDVSAQPSGTAPRWRFKTLNNKNVELHDVYFYWV